MKKSFLLSLMMLLYGNLSVLIAQSASEVEQQINDIKLNTDYIYAESTDSEWETALENAKILLAEQIEDWVIHETKNKDVEGILTKSNKHIIEVKAMRGRFYRAFLYVKKDDVMAYSGSDTVIMIPMSKTSSTTKGEEPQTVVAPEKKPEVVIEEQSKDATKVIETDKAGQQPIPEVSADSVGIRTVMQLSQREKELMDLKEFNQIEDYIRWRYSSNILKGYGQNRDIPENLDCYLIVYERSSGKIIAHLHKVGNTFTNLDSGKIEPITSYQDKGIVWLQFK